MKIESKCERSPGEGIDRQLFLHGRRRSHGLRKGIYPVNGRDSSWLAVDSCELSTRSVSAVVTLVYRRHIALRVPVVR